MKTEGACKEGTWGFALVTDPSRLQHGTGTVLALSKQIQQRSVMVYVTQYETLFILFYSTKAKDVVKHLKREPVINELGKGILEGLPLPAHPLCHIVETMAQSAKLFFVLKV